MQLLDRGEEKLIQAVEKGHIPITIAITISRSDDKGIQKALADAYENNSLRGKQLIRARRLLEQRRIRGKKIRDRIKRNGDQVPANEVLETYRAETMRQSLVIQKAKISEMRLMFAVTAIKQLFENENFVNLLRAEHLDTLPQYLADHIFNGGVPT